MRGTTSRWATIAELTKELNGSMAAHEANVSELSEAHGVEVTNTGSSGLGSLIIARRDGEPWGMGVEPDPIRLVMVTEL